MPPAVVLSTASTPDAPIADERAAGLPDDAAGDDAWRGITRWSTTIEGRREGLTAMSLSGLYCAACAGTIEQALVSVPGVLAAQVHYGQASAEVRWDPQRTAPEAWVAAIRAAGYRCAPDAAAPTRALRLHESRQSLWRLFVAGFCMMQVMMYATPGYVAAPGDLEPDLARLLQWACWVLSIPVVLFSAGPFFRAALQQLRHGRPGMDVPVALGVVVTFVVSTGATFDPGGVFGHEVYFDSLTMFVAFLLGGRWLELRARHRAAAAMEAMVARRAETALRVDGQGVETLVPVASLQVGDRVRVRAGDALPADGVVIEGRSAADESMLTGESRPVDKTTGDTVLAGSLNLNGPLLLRRHAGRRGHASRGDRRADARRDGAAPRADACGRPHRRALPVGRAAAGGCRCGGVDGDRPVAGGVGRGLRAHRHLPLRPGAGRPVGAAGQCRRAVAPRRAAAPAGCGGVAGATWTCCSSTRPAR